MARTATPRRLAAYTAQELREKFPHVADAFESLMKRERRVHKKYYPNYIGRYRIPGRESSVRRVTIGSILECLEDYGYAVSIRVSEPGAG